MSKQQTKTNKRSRNETTAAKSASEKQQHGIKLVTPSGKNYEGQHKLDEMVLTMEACLQLLNDSNNEPSSDLLNALIASCSKYCVNDSKPTSTAGKSYVSFPHVLCSFDRYWLGIEKVDHFKWPVRKLQELCSVILHFISHFPFAILFKVNTECLAVAVTKPGYVLFDPKQRDDVTHGPHAKIVAHMNDLINCIKQIWLKSNDNTANTLEITVVKRSGTSFETLPTLSPGISSLHPAKEALLPKEDEETTPKVPPLKTELSDSSSSSSSSSDSSSSSSQLSSQSSEEMPVQTPSKEASQPKCDDEDETKPAKKEVSSETASSSSDSESHPSSSSSSSSSEVSEAAPSEDTMVLEFICCLCNKAQSHDLLFKHESCSHKFDRDCARACFLQVIEVGNMCPLNALKCPDENCNAELPLSEAESVLEPHERRQLRKQLLETGTIHRINCPEIGCGGVQFLTPKAQFDCPECGHQAFVFSES